MSDEQSDDEFRIEPLDPALYPPSAACLGYMASLGYDPQMPVVRGVVTSGFMARLMATRPEVANSLQLLVGPFGVVAPTTDSAFRVAELQVGDVVLDVEAEYEP